MFEDVNEYMKRPLVERQVHLNLDDDCIDIGGNSENFRGLLAHYLKTNMPKGIRIQLCHACGNKSCSNPVHLYWGTPKENIADSIAHGTHENAWVRMVKKYGEDEVREIRRRQWDK
jgi:hypothetical protein